MSKDSIKLNICWLYPDILKGFCDEANVNAFIKRCQWRNIEPELYTIKAHDRIMPSKYDFYYIGGNNIDALDECSAYLSKNAKELSYASKMQIPILAVNCGYVLLGKSYLLENQTEKKGIGIFSIHSQETKNLYSGNVIGKCSFLGDRNIVGYKNHFMSSTLSEDTNPFMMLKKGYGNSEKNKFEGAIIDNTIGTYITSPIMAQNPHLCDSFIATSLKVRYKTDFQLSPLCDDIEWYSHNYIVETKKFL